MENSDLRYTLRMDRTLFAKYRYVAKYNGRSANKEIEQVILAHIEKWEREHGPITIDDEFVVHDIKVIEGDKGLFIAMPSKKATDGEYRDIAHPINSSTREKIQKIILDRYQKALLEPDGEII